MTDDEEIKDLNLKFRGIDSPTDVLSFPADESEILAISYFRRQANRPAAEYGHSGKRIRLFIGSRHPSSLVMIMKMKKEREMLKQEEILNALNYRREKMKIDYDKIYISFASAGKRLRAVFAFRSGRRSSCATAGSLPRERGKRSYPLAYAPAGGVNGRLRRRRPKGDIAAIGVVGATDLPSALRRMPQVIAELMDAMRLSFTI